MSSTQDHSQPRKFVLKKEILRQLTPSKLKLVAGGATSTQTAVYCG